jgi:hypothetical protein
MVPGHQGIFHDIGKEEGHGQGRGQGAGPGQGLSTVSILEQSWRGKGLPGEMLAATKRIKQQLADSLADKHRQDRRMGTLLQVQGMNSD